MCKSPEANRSRSFFFFRDPLSITKRFELGDPERKNYEEDSSDAHRKLRELKETIRARDLPLVDGYSLENLHELLLNCLTSMIDLDFPADEAAAQCSSLVSRNEISAYYRNESVHKALQTFASSSTLVCSREAKKRSSTTNTGDRGRR